MSSPSTPRTTRSASPTGASPDILTPGRKIKAMLAAFDSDSESENETRTREAQKPAHRSIFGAGVRSKEGAETDDDEDEGVVLPRGRMAARMQGGTSQPTVVTDEKETAFERVSRALRADHKSDSPSSPSSGGDELPAAGPKRRLAKGKKQAQTFTEEGDASDRSPSPARSFSPLFMSSPAASRRGSVGEPADQDSNDEGEAPQQKSNSRFLALVAQKRKEREEKERIEAEKKAARVQKMKQFSSDMLSGGESAEEDNGDDSGRRLTQQSRPARKASKKAIEEMNRETQRMSRNMQLAHQARTKKKITKESFFARFNFMQPDGAQPAESASASSTTTTTTGESRNSSDAEANKGTKTPRTSPAPEVLNDKAAPAVTNNPVDNEDREIPSLDDLLAGKYQLPEDQPVAVERVEVQSEEPHEPHKETKLEHKTLTGPPVRVRLSRQTVAEHQKEDSDSDLEVITSPAKCRRIAAFENLPVRKNQESGSMRKLKALAHLTSPTRRSASMTTAELSANLLYQARAQAARERQERIQELRAKGIIIETAEERAAIEDDVEDLMEKARKEAEEIARRENKKKKTKSGEGDEDEDDEEDMDFELSGSDEEMGDGDDGEGSTNGDPLVEEEADEDDESDDDDKSEPVFSDDEHEEPLEMPTARRKRPTRVISDDEDDEDDKGGDPQEPRTPAKSMPPSATPVERPHFPGFPASGNLTMSLTQAFAGTLGGSQLSGQEDASAIPPSIPDPVQERQASPLPDQEEDSSQFIVKDSQEQQRQTPDLYAGYPRVTESPAQHSVSQFSQVPDPTQDEGFVYSPFDPSKRFIGTPPPGTVDTVLLTQSQSPIVNRYRGKLHRGRAGQTETPAGDEDGDGGLETKASAFDVMKKATKKKPAVVFDKTKSKAKDIVEEAAEESEDEYAGLGGASDDSDGEEDIYDREMINDNSGEVVDEKELAALNAVHQRDADEKQVAKLLKDITTGALRRRRGGDDDFDLDDSDDEQAARRRRKQREFAKMRKALMADEKVGELAENPKKAAFFRAIEDRNDDDDFNLEFLETGDEASSQDVSERNESGEPGAPNKKRPLESSDEVANRPPPHLRRTAASAMSKRPATLAEIRETLSFLTEQQEYDSFREDASIDEAAEEERQEESEESETAAVTHSNGDGFAIPRHPRRTRGPVVDRLALLRQASSNSASSTLNGPGNGRLAFHSGSDAAGPIGFRPPALLRRASSSRSTSSSTSSSTTSNGSTTTTSSSRVTKPAKGSVNYYTAAREKERERQIRAKQRTGSNIAALLSKHAGGLKTLGGGEWE
ncbi:hypothetical protein ASPZODRAFT_14840 [Penicilliopsis zonata CBS 506.65]|uniref:DNA replication checkpoint mediator MRC1 domain-containing protein n=1 Tax=Penicilliopsis zonata CBS 506.65 TaxID=1073090 RepID=A0A1L9SNS9_9EURO|nr:hypothetical protein ASPZODRAFT_14840 [Penicilliopsis zonata CBS 506.65]OJJ48714.1 hypothetical protein ASPZODRAFT_14840 [Penicilliopsis zonata CBS 506.65]